MTKPTTTHERAAKKALGDFVRHAKKAMPLLTWCPYCFCAFTNGKELHYMSCLYRRAQQWLEEEKE